MAAQPVVTGLKELFSCFYCKSEPMRGRFDWQWLLGLVLGVQLVGAAQAGLPDIGSPEDAVLSPREERELSREMLHQIRRTMPVLDDPEMNSYIASLGLRLLANAPGGHPDFRFLLIQDARINAFAAPGGLVAVNTGLFLAARNEAELAAVVAHEIAHVTQRHIVRAYSKGSRTDFASQLALLAAVLLAGYGGNPELAEAALYSTVAANVQQKLSFSRTHEHEADRIGINILANAGLDPKAMPQFFETLQQRSFTGDNAVPEFLRTHPLTSERISDARGRAAQMEGPFRQDSLAFRLMQARAFVYTAATEALKARLQATREGDQPEQPASRYRQALAWIRLEQPAKAIERLEPLIQAHPDRLPFQLARAEAWLAMQRPEKALAGLQEVAQLVPQHPPIVALLAQALLQAGRPKQAMERLEATLARHPEHGVLLKLKARAAALADAPALSHEAMARYYASMGQTAPALDQIELALAVPELALTLQQRLESKRDELRRRINSQRAGSGR